MPIDVGFICGTPGSMRTYCWSRMRMQHIAISPAKRVFSHAAATSHAGVRVRGAVHVQNVNACHSRFLRMAEPV
jgi:hypothetical protein